MTVKKKRIMRRAMPASQLDQIAEALTAVLGSSSAHRASDSVLGVPRVWVPSGVPDLDEVLDRKRRGWPSSRIVEIYGGPATCKTGLGLSLVAQCQSAGGDAILYPVEGEYDEWLAERYGVDLSRLLVVEDPEALTVESVFSSFLKATKAVGRKGLLVGMIDSVAAFQTNAELKDESFDRDRAAQVRAMQISKAMRKIAVEVSRSNVILFCINQTREASDAHVPTKPKPPGGQALKFHSSIRLRLETLGKIKRQRKGKPYVAGFKLKITAEKNRLSQPFQEANIVLDFDKGLIRTPKARRKNR